MFPPVEKARGDSMRKVAVLASVLVVALMFSGCARQSQNTYRYDEVGRSSAVSFGTIVAVRPVDIIGQNTGLGAGLGATAGAGVGSQIGQGTGNAWAVVGGVIIGAVAGAIAEQAVADRTGVEYTVTLESGVTLTIVQETPQGERILGAGERVIVQNTGGYQRVLSATHLPTQIKRPAGIKVIDQ